MNDTRRSTLAVLEAADQLLSSVDHTQRQTLSCEERVHLMRLARRVVERMATLSHVLTDEVNQANAALPATGTPITSLIALDEQRDNKEATSQVFHASAVNKHEAARDAALAGDISDRHAAAISRAMAELPDGLTPLARKRAEEILVTKAGSHTPRQLGRLAPAVLAEVAPDLIPDQSAEANATEARRARAVARRSFQYGDDGDGSVWFRGSLPEAEATPFIRSIEAFVERDRRAARNRERDLRDAGAGPAEFREQRGVDARRTPAQRRADALVELSRHVRDTPTTVGDRPRLVVTVTLDALQSRADGAGILPSGDKLSAGELRRLCCDADLVPVVLGARSEILDVGRSRRLVTPAIRRALSLRDRGCVFPNCDIPDTGCDAHHVVPWIDGGETALSNLALLCPHHHALVEPDRARRREDRWRLWIDKESGRPCIAAPRRLRESGADSRSVSSPPGRQPRREHAHALAV